MIVGESKDEDDLVLPFRQQEMGLGGCLRSLLEIRVVGRRRQLRES